MTDDTKENLKLIAVVAMVLSACAGIVGCVMFLASCIGS